MATEEKVEIAVGQIWRRKKSGKLIRIERANQSAGFPAYDDWVWRGVDYTGRGVSYGGYIRRDCELVEEESHAAG
jgi:hypothetical protein